MRNHLRSLLVPVAVVCMAGLGLSACSPDAEDASLEAGAADVETDQTLTAALGEQADGDGFVAVLDNSGLSTALEGVGPYTVFVPSDAALGADAEGLSDEAMSAPAAALVRAHIVPGALGRDDIQAAIDAAGNGEVQMRTMDDGLLTFSRDGETLVVSAPDGTTARLSGSETRASNGVIQPVDAVLVKTEAGE